MGRWNMQKKCSVHIVAIVVVVVPTFSTFIQDHVWHFFFSNKTEKNTQRKYRKSTNKRIYIDVVFFRTMRSFLVVFVVLLCVLLLPIEITTYTNSIIITIWLVGCCRLWRGHRQKLNQNKKNNVHRSFLFYLVYLLACVHVSLMCCIPRCSFSRSRSLCHSSVSRSIAILLSFFLFFVSIVHSSRKLLRSTVHKSSDKQRPFQCFCLWRRAKMQPFSTASSLLHHRQCIFVLLFF